MIETKVGEPKQEKVLSLAFRVKAHEDNLFSAEMLLLEGNTVINSRESVATTLGHAIGAMDNMADGWAIDMVERGAQDYFDAVIL